jgi:hypothetical protein
MATTVKAKAESKNGQTTETDTQRSQQVTIAPLQIGAATFRIRGTSPLVHHKFSQKAKDQIQQRQEEGAQGNKRRTKTPRDFQDDYERSLHRLADGSYGIPAGAFRAALVSACRLVNFKMTLAKLSVFVQADGYDVDGTALVRMTKGEPHPTGPLPVRNETGVVDLRNRAMFDPGWEALVTIRYDRQQFSLADVTNLLIRVGMQIGLLEGRNDSKNSCGFSGWGGFEIVPPKAD